MVVLRMDAGVEPHQEKDLCPPCPAQYLDPIRRKQLIADLTRTDLMQMELPSSTLQLSRRIPMRRKRGNPFIIDLSVITDSPLAASTNHKPITIHDVGGLSPQPKFRRTKKKPKKTLGDYFGRM